MTTDQRIYRINPFHPLIRCHIASSYVNVALSDYSANKVRNPFFPLANPTVAKNYRLIGRITGKVGKKRVSYLPEWFGYR